MPPWAAHEVVDRFTGFYLVYFCSSWHWFDALLLLPGFEDVPSVLGFVRIGSALKLFYWVLPSFFCFWKFFGFYAAMLFYVFIFNCRVLLGFEGSFTEFSWYSRYLLDFGVALLGFTEFFFWNFLGFMQPCCSMYSFVIVGCYWVSEEVLPSFLGIPFIFRTLE